MTSLHYLSMCVLCTAFSLLTATSATLAEVSQSTHSSLEQEVRTASMQYLSALRLGDAAAVAACWTAEGVYVDAHGQTFPARALVHQEFEQASSAEDQSLADHGDTVVRFITNTVAIERRTASKDQTKDRQFEFFAIWKKSENRWQLDYLQEFSRAARTSPSALESLNWMVGEWQAEQDGIRARLSVHWSADRKYLEQRFTAELPGQADLRAEQRLAWDAAEQQIRSWLFRSDGGFVEGTWQQSGDIWISKTVGTMPDGTKTKSINVWSPESPQRCLFKTHRSTVNDEPIEDLLLEFTRVDSPTSP